MKKNRLLSLILVLTMLVGMLIPGTIYADEESAPASEPVVEEVVEQEPEQIPEEPAGEEPAPVEDAEPEASVAQEEPQELDAPAQQEEPQEPAAPTKQEEPQEPAAPTKQEEPQEPVNPTQQEEPQEPAAPAEETSTNKPEEAARFESGYVQIKANTEVYADIYMIQVAGTFTADSVVYAEVNTKAEDAGDDWLKITFDTEAAKAEGVAFGTAFIQEKNVQILTDEETETLLTDLPEDTREYNEKKLPLASFEMAVVEETADETGKEEADPDAKNEEDEDLNPTQGEEPGESEVPAEEGFEGEASADELQEAAQFESGYVWIKANTEVFTDEYMTQSAGTFTAYSVVYAEINTKSEEAGENWLKITFDTEAAKTENAAFETAFIQEKNVRILTEEEAEVLLADLPEDTRAYNEKMLPLTFFEKFEKIAEDEEGEGLTVDPEDIEANDAGVITITSPKEKGDGNYVVIMNENGTATVKGKSTLKKLKKDNFIIQVSEDGGQTWNKLEGETTKVTWDKDAKKYTAKFKVLPEYIEEGNTYQFRVLVQKENEEAVLESYESPVFSVERAFTACITNELPIKKGITENAELKAKAVNAAGKLEGTATYQWYYAEVGTEEEFKYKGTGAKTKKATITVDEAGTVYNYEYWCVIKGTNGEATTERVQIEKPFDPKLEANNSTPGYNEDIKFEVSGAPEDSKLQLQEYNEAKGKWVKNKSVSEAKGTTIGVKIDETWYDKSYRILVTSPAKQKEYTKEITLTRPYTVSLSANELTMGFGETQSIVATVSEDCQDPEFQWYVLKPGVPVEMPLEHANIDGVTVSDSDRYIGNQLNISATDEIYDLAFRLVVEANGRVRSDLIKINRPFTVAVTPKAQKAAGVDSKVTWTVTVQGSAGMNADVYWDRSTDDFETFDTVEKTTGLTLSKKGKATSTYKRPIEEADYDGVAFRCRVVSDGKEMHSNVLTVVRPFEVELKNPEGGIFVAGIGVPLTLKVKATGASGTFKYQWERIAIDTETGEYGGSWTTIKGATSRKYEISKTTEEDYSTLYRCAVTGSNGKVYSDPIRIVKPFEPSILIDPETAGLDDHFTLTAGYVLPENAKANITSAIYTLEKSTDEGTSWQVQEPKQTSNETFDLTVLDNWDAGKYENTYDNLYRIKVELTGTLYGNADTYVAYTEPVGLEKPFTPVAVSDDGTDESSKGLGRTAKFTASVEGENDWRWQIQKTEGGVWTDLEDNETATSKMLQVKVNNDDVYKYSYRGLVTATVGGIDYTVATNPVRVVRPFTLSVNSPTAGFGETATLTATVEGLKVIPEDANFEWKRIKADGSELTEQEKEYAEGGKDLAITVAPEDYNDSFRCVVTIGENVVVSDPVKINPVFTVSVSTGELGPGKYRNDKEKVTFTVKTSTAVKTFTWEYSTDGGKTWSPVNKEGTAKTESTKKATLTVKGNNDTYGRSFRCIAKDKKGKEEVSDICYVEPTIAANYNYNKSTREIKGVEGKYVEETYQEITGYKAVPSGAVTLPAGANGIKIGAIADGEQTGTDAGGGMIGNGVFAGTGITSIYLPATITQIGAFAFYDCSGLTSVDLSNGVFEIGAAAFKNCSSLSSMNSY